MKRSSSRLAVGALCGLLAGGLALYHLLAASEGSRWTAAQPEVVVWAEDGAEMVFVPAGEFTMGSDDGHFDERPAHRVRLEAFLIDRFEVTNELFERYDWAVGRPIEGPWRRGFGRGQERFPVRYVSWQDARGYCAMMGKRLPTEAEWEYAARGGDGRTYPWGSRWLPGAARAGLEADAGCAAVGSYPAGASPFGAEDLVGNVWEWTADWYDRWIYRERSVGVTASPAGPIFDAGPLQRFVEHGTAPGNERSTVRVIRGGGWSGPGEDLARASRRMFGRPDGWYPDTGFRCAAAASAARGATRAREGS